MKVRTHREIPQANKIFTDREQPRISFWNSYNEYKTNIQTNGEIKVLAYYGIGGIGKTSLLRKLVSEMNEKLDRPQYVYYDFNVKQDSRSVLESIKNMLVKEYKMNFPMFDMALFNYAQKIGEEISAPEIQTFIGRSQLLGTIVTAADLIPGADIISKIINTADTSIAFLRNLINNHKTDMRKIQNNTPDEIYASLPYYFALDLTDNLTNKKEPLVIFLDTYEQLVNEMSSVGEPLTNDEWIRGENGLVQNIPNVLWVIAGREKLKWERFDPEWSSALEQHILGTLSKYDGTHFLEIAGVEDDDLRKSLYELTQGTPVYLDLCVDRYFSMIESGKVPEVCDFGCDVYSLIERFVRYMDDSRKDIVYVLACLRCWNDEMISEIGFKVLPSFNLTTYEKVKGFSFITESSEGTYNLHQVVGDVLRHNCPEMIRSRTINAAIELCKQIVSSVGIFSEEYEYYLLWLNQYGINGYDNDREIIEFFKNNIREGFDKLCTYGRYETANKIIEIISALAENNTESELFAYINILLSDLFKSRRFDKEWNDHAYIAYKLYLNLFGLKNEDTLIAYAKYGSAQGVLGYYNNELDIKRTVYKNRCELFGENDSRTLFALFGVANSLSSLGRYNEAIEIDKQVLRLRTELLGKEHQSVLDSMYALARDYTNLGSYKEAFELDQKLLKKRTALLGEDHPDVLSDMCALARDYRYTNQYQEALKLDQYVSERYRDLFGEDHPKYVQMLHNLAWDYSNLDMDNESCELNKIVLEKRIALFGEDHPDTIWSMHNLACDLSALQRQDEAIPLAKKVIEKRNRILGSEHPDTIFSETLLAYCTYKSKDYANALSIYQNVLEKQQRILGYHHPKTQSTRRMVANCFEKLHNYDKAVETKVYIYRSSLENKGADDSETITALNNLVWCYHLAERSPEGIEYSEMLEDYYSQHNEITVARILHLDTVAVVYAEGGKIERAIEIAEELIEDTISSFPEDQKSLGTRYYTAALVYLLAGNLGKAGDYAEKSYNIRKNLGNKEETDESMKLINRIKS